MAVEGVEGAGRQGPLATSFCSTRGDDDSQATPTDEMPERESKQVITELSARVKELEARLAAALRESAGGDAAGPPVARAGAEEGVMP